MAEIIPDMQSRRGRPSLYNWNEWTDGKARKLTQGQDFHSGLLSMRTMIHRKARDLHLHAITRINEVNKTIEVQFFDDK